MKAKGEFPAARILSTTGRHLDEISENTLIFVWKKGWAGFRSFVEKPGVFL